ncbi:DUF6705 family protein [Flavobacterium psychraquaticum]|uniref:DUF6705 family protein n=1 Tax=Flavobacterium psychraquaticum TaxID=3103958 RepID=UPI002ACEB960|nr:hypothetical protein [Flavobacterium sp. LB-N7T]
MRIINFKNTLTILLFFTTVVSFSQTQPFIGTWEYQTGNSIFRVIITPNTSGHVESAPLMGRYFKVNINNGVETMEYSSDLAPLGSFLWEPGFYANIREGHPSLISGSLIDLTYPDPSKSKWGGFSITINTISCLTCPLTANWKVVRPSGLRLDNEPLDYNIPTSIVLTKQ